jgi:hypothetical protein
MATIVKLLCIASIFIWQTSTTTSETLSNTKWSGTFNVPGPMSGTLEFKKDTVLLSIEGEVVESMTYKEKGDTLSFQKIYGQSPCSEEIGDYKYQLKDNVLVLTAIQDACDMRANAFSKEGYKKE